MYYPIILHHHVYGVLQSDLDQSQLQKLQGVQMT